MTDDNDDGDDGELTCADHVPSERGGRGKKRLSPIPYLLTQNKLKHMLPGMAEKSCVALHMAKRI